MKDQVLAALQSVIENHIATSHKTPIIGCGSTGNMSGPEQILLTCRDKDGNERKFKLSLEEVTEGGKVARDEAAVAAG